MAANKFATMLHRNTHKCTVILVYAVLEWVLIFLLLMNSLFSFLITKFANYFGLKPPCLWCSRVDHILEPNKNSNSYRDHLCEAHATEISKLGYCPNHRKLAESQNLCQDCLPTQPRNNEISTEISPKIAFFTWVSENRTENGEKNSRCSCCDESLSSKIYPSYLLIKPNWGVLDYIQKANLIGETVNDDNSGCEYSDTCKSDSQTDPYENGCDTEQKKEEVEDKNKWVEDEEDDQILSDVDSFSFGAAMEEDYSRSVINFRHDIKKEGNQDEEANSETKEHRDFMHEHEETIQIGCEEDELRKRMNLTPEDNEYCDFEGLIMTVTSEKSYEKNTEEEDLVGRYEHYLYRNFDSEPPQAEPQVTLLVEEAGCVSVENSSILMAEQMIQDIVGGICEHLVHPTPCTDDRNVKAAAIEETNNLQEGKEEEENRRRLSGDETKSEMMNGNQVSGHELANNQTREKEPTPSLSCLQVDESSSECEFVGISTGLEASMTENHQGLKKIEKDATEERTILGGKNQERINHHLSTNPLPNEEEEDKFPDTPTYTDGLHHLHRKLLLSDKRESGIEESWDGSVASEVEGNDGSVTIERLTSALRAEHKALTALYAELEEERSAAAIAANQTMAMITRLQEEKAAMQMEALQYQRMMEEQSEYDQEALQLLNELMMKREKEKQELEKELDIYRKKVSEYEVKEKTMSIRRKDGSVRSRDSSASCSNGEDCDELSFDLVTPTNLDLNVEDMGLCVKHLSSLDESLAQFEEERLSILEELKALEEKLFTLGDEEEERLFEDVKPIEENDFPHNYSNEFSSPEENEFSNMFCGVLDGKHFSENKIMALKAKTLLPLFDAIGVETKEEELNEEELNEEHNESDSTRMKNSLVSETEMENKKLAIEEEVDHLYERLQALEADREFLKHCISSLKKGDKGMDLLQEILQHLRDLRTVEFNVKNMNDSPQS